jgi:hypothetical protein
MLKENIDRIFQLSRKNYFYSNTNTFQMKLQSLQTPDAQKLILSIFVFYFLPSST